ncbi:MAG: A/G-specific adenine glycosylase [Acidimicrobiales bacterium]
MGLTKAPVAVGAPRLAAADALLLAWFAEHGRHDLPWRRTRDPWAVLVAEMMLQQTQVSRVIPRYQQFLRRFPTVIACAQASPGAVIEEWQGLGYNRRALNLWRAAGVAVARFDGELPRSLADLLTLPGVGAYTARAICAFAHEHHVGVVDTNVARVLARTEGRALNRAEAQALADQAVPPGQAWAWNQALMDLGSQHCRSRGPQCPTCPIRRHCAWSGSQQNPSVTSAHLAAVDPAVGSAGTSRSQSPFAGSDRQGRGRLVAALRAGPVRAAEVAHIMGWPQDPERANRVAATVLADGLAQLDDGHYRLP